MILELITIFLLLIIVLMQFHINNYTKIVSIFLGIILLILQSHNAYENYKFRQLNISKINDIQSSLEYTIDWQHVKPKIEFVNNNINQKIANLMVIPIKIYPLKNLELVSNNLNINEIIKKSYENNVFKYKELRSEDVVKIFDLFADLDGNIYQDIEEKANIGHIYLKPKNIENNFLHYSVQYSGLEPLKNFNTLQKLNNTILITRLPNIGDIKRFNFVKNLQLSLPTDRGTKRLYFNNRLSANGKIKLVGYMGIYIPKDFFK